MPYHHSARGGVEGRARQIRPPVVQYPIRREANSEVGAFIRTRIPRDGGLIQIEAELPRLWDLRRRLEAARAAGLDKIPVAPPPNPGDLIG